MRLSCASVCALFVAAIFSSAFSPSTATVSAASAAAIAQGFQTEEEDVKAGAIMALKDNSPNNVEFATQDKTDKIVGVVGENPLVSLTDGGRSVQIVTSGVTTALVSDINGEVKTGDKITSSPIAGTGMKVSTSNVIVGTAQADLSSVKTTQHEITDTEGGKHTVKVGLIPVQVNVMFYAAPNDKVSFLPSFLQDFANGVAGKEVSPVRVMISAIIMLLSFLSIAVLLYASVKSSIISIGRNPLSEVSVRKSLFQIGAIVIAILLLALITIYLILST
jgi:hypothetical protein